MLEAPVTSRIISVFEWFKFCYEDFMTLYIGDTITLTKIDTQRGSAASGGCPHTDDIGIQDLVIFILCLLVITPTNHSSTTHPPVAQIL